MQRWLYSRYSTVNPFFWLLVHLQQYLVVGFIFSDSESESFTILFSESAISLSFILLRDLLAILDKSLWDSESNSTITLNLNLPLPFHLVGYVIHQRWYRTIYVSLGQCPLSLILELLNPFVAIQNLFVKPLQLSLRRLPSSRFYWIHSLFVYLHCLPQTYNKLLLILSRYFHSFLIMIALFWVLASLFHHFWVNLVVFQVTMTLTVSVPDVSDLFWVFLYLQMIVTLVLRCYQ